MIAFLTPFYFYFLGHTSEADGGVCNIDPEVLHLGIPCLFVYTPTGGALAISSTL